MQRFVWLGWLGLWTMVTLAGDGWPQFRGPDRDGVVNAENLNFDWSNHPPAELWRVPIGEGFAGIAVADDRLYTLFADEDSEYLGCFDSASGKAHWRQRLGAKFTDQFGNGPRSTPTLDGDRVYALGAMGDLYAFQADDGRQDWHVSLTARFGAEVSTWGYSTAPLIDGNHLIVEVGGGDGKAVAALVKSTGETLWHTANGLVGYSSPIAVDVGGHRQYIFLLGKSLTEYTLTGISLTGEVLWTHALKGFHIAMPILVPPDRIFVSASNDDGCTMVQIEPNGEAVGVREAWANRVMRNTFNSCVYKDGHLYGFNNATLRCVTTNDGEYTWAKRGYGKGSLILAGNHLIALSDRGKLVAARAKPDSYEERGSLQALNGKSWTSPTLADGRLYLRNQSEMVCYDLRKP